MDKRKLLNFELHRIGVEEFKALPPGDVAVVLDGIRSAHNVGSVLRTCDAFRIACVCLCGITAVPPSAEIHKSALGAEDSVTWKHYDDTMDAISELRSAGYEIISIEQTVGSVSLDAFVREPGRKYALVFGNEVDGVRQDVVDASDMAIEIPQWGTKHSLNVSVAAGVILWHFRPLQ